MANVRSLLPENQTQDLLTSCSVSTLAHPSPGAPPGGRERRKELSPIALHFLAPTDALLHTYLLPFTQRSTQKEGVPISTPFDLSLIHI